MRLAWCSLLLSLAASSLASSGDRAQVYQSCVATCLSAVCQPPTTYSPSLALRLTRWSCADDCGYFCMHKITDEAVREGSRIHQYHGKWPFWRWVGIQEPASVIFSVMNLAVHVKGVRRLQRTVPEGHPMKGYYINLAFVSINAWIWSSVFHTRDLPATEALDYFSAAAAILYGLYYTVIRLYHLYPEPNFMDPRRLSSKPRSNLWRGLCLILFIGHVSYLSILPRFNYTYNMIFNVVIGLLHNVLWLAYALPTGHIRRFLDRAPSYRPAYAYKGAVFVIATTLAMSLELLDFPPWLRFIDAHALWHLATVPIAWYWYGFLEEDALDENWRCNKTI
ncbi:Per1-like protein [Cristinia sonorae]|uniref:Post-GPI attachment to proteins factor 3 n=1 Tax=Cristinia sonorae TaxID=1940300 RepID=A0A8K0UQ61_9AGAR|nr:Per1-like protein [Cristinia sonorae]